MVRPARRTGRLSQWCYGCRMSEVASRELRNQTRALLDRVAAGERITITVDGKPVARLVPPEPRQRWMHRETFVAHILGHQADPGLKADLVEPAPDTTDDTPL
jgi:prevent-host-death family protein